METTIVTDLGLRKHETTTGLTEDDSALTDKITLQSWKSIRILL